MGLLDSVLGTMMGNPQRDLGTTAQGPIGATALIGIVGALLERNGGLQGLANKFSQAGHADKFASWVSTGENRPISPDQVHQALGSDQISALASKFGIDPSHASQLLAQVLPTAVDKLTPQGQIDPAANHPEGLSALLPKLMQSLGGSAPQN